MFDFLTFEKDVNLIMTIAEDCGLNFFDIEFLVCPPEVISFIAAYSLPTRFAHWSFGKRFQRLLLQYKHGLSRIYEVVYFADPCRAFLLENNSRVENMVVAAHVIGHSDFFKNNVTFSHTRKDAPQMMALNTDFINRCGQEYGLERVEKVLDAALSLRHNINCKEDTSTLEGSDEHDLLLFITRHSQMLNDWERSLIEIVRKESCYFRPLLQTRLFNEGWAAYWHIRLLKEMDLCERDAIELAMINAVALEPNGIYLNPYSIGVDILKEIHKTKGDSELFAIRRQENDYSFFRKYVTEDLIECLGLAAYSSSSGTDRELDAGPKEIKSYLLQNLFNCGLPRIYVDKQQSSGGMLYLLHDFDGRTLNRISVRKTLEHVFKLWGEPISLLTMEADRDIVFIYDGICHKMNYL